MGADGVEHESGPALCLENGIEAGGKIQIGLERTCEMSSSRLDLENYDRDHAGGRQAESRAGSGNS